MTNGYYEGNKVSHSPTPDTVARTWYSETFDRNRVIPSDEMERILASTKVPAKDEDARWKSISVYRNENNEGYRLLRKHNNG